VTAFLLGLVPSIGVLILFWIGIKAIVEADRRERSAQAAIEARTRAAGAHPAPRNAAPRNAAPPKPAPANPGEASGAEPSA